MYGGHVDVTCGGKTEASSDITAALSVDDMSYTPPAPPISLASPSPPATTNNGMSGGITSATVTAASVRYSSSEVWENANKLATA